MRSLKIMFLLLLAGGASYAQGVKFANNKPEAGEKVQFTYDPKGTKLENLTDIKCTSYIFSSEVNPKSTKVELTKDGNVYKGEIATPDSVTLVGLTFFAGDSKDDAPLGYMLEYSKGGKIPAETYMHKGFLYGLAGNYFLGLTLNPEKGTELYKQAFALKPELREKNINLYLEVEYKANKETGAKLINEQIATLSRIKEPKEKDLKDIFNLYSLLKQKAQSDSVKAIILKKFPTGTFAFNEDMNVLYGTKDFELQEQKAINIIEEFKFDPAKKNDKARLNSIYGLMANSSLRAKNIDKFVLYVDKIDNKLSKAGLYNSFAWPSAEKKENLDLATELSKQSLTLVEQAKNDERPAWFDSQEKYLKSLNQSYGMYADTYALLLYHKGKFKEALTFQEKAVPLYATPSPGVIERYVTYLIKDGQDDKAYLEADKIIKEGKATDSTKNNFKMLFVKLKKEGNVSAYLANLEKAALEKERAEWTKKMINTPAPTFSLKNLKGETVNLTDFKGKVVILDYWATWCGPCVASFPGMQKAIEKYSSNPNVVFLFINTFQREDNREKVVTDFVAQKKLDFNVLYDTKNAKDPSQFDTATAYKFNSIPTKFIIDGDGNIRFKAVGFSGSDDSVVKEIDAMVGLLLPKETGK